MIWSAMTDGRSFYGLEPRFGRRRDGEGLMADGGQNRDGVRPVDSSWASARGFMENPVLGERIEAVLNAIPEAVRRDFSDDPQFHMAVDDYVPGKGRSVWMASPKPYGNGSRSVVLKPQLADRPRDFALYVIAHELAHAHLRNGGWKDIQDPEQAADALAESWGFGRPPNNPKRATGPS